MSLSISQLKTDREWRSSTGLSQDKFINLLGLFTASYYSVYQVDITTHQHNLRKDFAFDSCQDLLFYVLFCLKNPTVYDVRGLIFNLPTATADYNFEKGLVILEKALDTQKPARSFESLEAFLLYVKDHPNLTIDVTEVFIQRPQDKNRQKKTYSGKKNVTPIKF
jgi:hypothetical protein